MVRAIASQGIVVQPAHEHLAGATGGAADRDPENRGARAAHLPVDGAPRQLPQDAIGLPRLLYTYHAEKTGQLMKEAGYDSETIDKVKKMVGKQGLKTDPDVQLIEDIACLVFIESYFLDFAEGYDEAKLVSIARKTWKKMSARARRAALELDLPDAAKSILAKALA